MKKIFLLLLLHVSTFYLFGQDISIARVGHDEILISNPNSYSISIYIGQNKKIILPSGGSIRQDFHLTTYNVKNTPFKMIYDGDSYDADIRFCDDAAYRRNIWAERNKNAFYSIGKYLKGEISLREVIIVLFLNGFIQGVSGEDKRTIELTLKSIFDSNNTYEAKEKMANDYLKSFLERQKEIITTDQTICQQTARSLLDRRMSNTVHASKFIDVLEKSHFEFSPFVSVGFRVNEFRKEGNKNSILRSSFASEPSYGARLVFNKSAYNKYKQRKTGMRYYFPITYLHTRAVYKKIATQAFPADTALSWDIVSAGFGWEFQKIVTKRDETLASIQIDVGIASSFLKKYPYPNSKLGEAKAISNFNGYCPYVNVAYKERVFNWLEIYASYYNTSLLYTLFKNDKKDMPAFRQFNLGLNINFARSYSYQY